MKTIKLFAALLIASVSLSAAAKERLKMLPPIKYSSAPATIKGAVKGYKQGQTNGSVLFTYKAFVSNKTDSVVSTIAPDGTFTAEVTNYYSDRVAMHWGDTVITFVVIPGEEMGVSIDPAVLKNAKSNKPAFTFTGTIGDFNTDLVSYEQEYKPTQVLAPVQGEEGTKSFKGFTVMQYRERLLELYDNASAKVDADKRLCGAFKDYVKSTYMYEIIVKSLLFNSALRMANDREENYEKPDGYYDYLVERAPFASPSFFYTMPPLQAVASVNMFSNYSGKVLDVNPSVEQVKKAYTYASTINSLNVLTDDEVAKMKAECPVLAGMLVQFNEELKEKIEAAKVGEDMIRELSPDVKGEDVFRELIAPYKGKPLLVDFWATWCGPCRAAMETIKPVKAELEGKANFVYLTGPSSPKRAWELTIPDIHGYHYYVTDEQYSTLMNQFESNSIPTYVTVDKDGNVINKYVGYPGNDVIKGDLSR